MEGNGGTDVGWWNGREPGIDGSWDGGMECGEGVTGYRTHVK